MRFYFLYLAIINIAFSENDIYKFNKVITILFIIQLPVQAIKFSYLGISENTIGTYATHGGGLTTVIPLVTLGYLVAYYYLYKKNLIYLILSAGFITYGILGAKLALLFLYPIAFLSLYYLNAVRIRGIHIPGDIYRVIFISMLTIIVGFSIMKYQARANKERKVGGKVSLAYTLEYTKKYTTGTRSYNENLALGRLATTKLAMKYLWEEGFTNLSFGYGPGVLNKYINQIKKKKYETRVEKIAGSYGHTGVVYIVSQYGILGLVTISIVYFIFIRRCWRLYKKEKNEYWKAFTSGSLFFACVSLFIFIAYNRKTIIGETILPVFYYCMAIVYIRSKKYYKSIEL
jgi:hypothetical protein